MKRLLLLAVLCLGFLAVPIQAQYVVITIDLNKFGLTQGQPGVGTPVQPGQPPVGQPKPEQPPPGQPNPGEPTSGTPEPAALLYAIVEVKNVQQVDPKHLSITHKWGQAYVPLEVGKYIQTPSIQSRFTDYKKVQKDWTKSPDKILNIAEWALKHGLLGDYVKLMTDLGKLDEKRPEGVNFRKIQTLLQNTPKTSDPRAEAFVKEREATDYRLVPSKQGHYALLTTLKSDDPSVVSRLQLLEHTYQSFFYWLALKGKVIEPPKHRLVGLIENGTQAFKDTHTSFGSPLLVGDGFTARRARTMILSSQRLDDLFAQLDRDNRNHWRNLNLKGEDVLAGGKQLNDVLRNHPKAQLIQPNLAPLQTLALVEGVLKGEGERATVSHEAIRQLLSATGLLPHNVAGGEWIQFGIASFFETPHYALFQGTALPSWIHLVNFKYYHQTNKLKEDSAAQILRGVVSDELFRQAADMERQARETQDVKSPLKQKAAEKLELARAASWALTYRLMDQNLDGVFAYLDELQKLPRDVEHDEAVLTGCFARAFKLSAATADNPNAINTQGLEKMAGDWFRSSSQMLLDVQGIEQELLRARLQPTQSGGTGVKGHGG